MLHYYSPSGRTTSGKAVSAYIFTLVVAYVLAIVYTIFIEVIPIIYVKFIISGVAAAALGFSIRSIGKIFKMRHKNEFMNLTYFGAFFFLYFSWIIFASILEIGSYSGAKDFGLHLDIIFSPILFFTWIGELSGVGTWGFGRVPVNGFPLIIIWIIEALILVVIPIAINWKKPLPPFSNKLEKWYPKYNLKQYFEYMVTANQFKSDLEKDYMDAISKLGKGFADRFGQISIYYLKNDSDAYLSFTNVFIEGKGTGKRNEALMIHTFRISSIDAEYLMEKYKKAKEFFLDH